MGAGRQYRNNTRSQCSSLVGTWLAVPEDHGSNPSMGKSIFAIKFKNLRINFFVISLSEIHYNLKKTNLVEKC